MKRQPNYKLKAAILTEGDQILVHKYDNLDYTKVSFLEGLDIEEDYKELLFKTPIWYLRECRRINNAYFARKKRLKNRIVDLLAMGSCIWLTLNFSNETLEGTSDTTRRKYVQRYLKSQSDYYVANIDFGNDGEYIDRHGNKRQATSREHYHALLFSDFIDMSFWNENYGWAFTERVRKPNSKKLALYITKLTQHAIKESTKRCCYIYSRSK